MIDTFFFCSVWQYVFIGVGIEDIKNNLKLFNVQHSYFWIKYFGETLLHPQHMVTELWLTDPLPELGLGGVLELGVSRCEPHNFESSCPPSLLRVGLLPLNVSQCTSTTVCLFVWGSGLHWWLTVGSRVGLGLFP